MNPKTETVKKWRENNVKKGLCRYCNIRAVKGKTMCQYHLDYHKWRKKLGKAKKN